MRGESRSRLPALQHPDWKPGEDREDDSRDDRISILCASLFKRLGASGAGKVRNARAALTMTSAPAMAPIGVTCQSLPLGELDPITTTESSSHCGAISAIRPSGPTTMGKRPVDRLVEPRRRNGGSILGARRLVREPLAAIRQLFLSRRGNRLVRKRPDRIDQGRALRGRPPPRVGL